MAKISEQVLQNTEANNSENKVTGWLSKIVEKLKTKTSNVNLSATKGVQVSHPNKGVINLAFIGGSYNIIVAEPHQIVEKGGDIKCSGNSCRCRSNCALGVQVKSDLEHTFEVDYQLI